MEEELAEDIFCDALDHFFCEGTDSIEMILGRWQRDLLDEKILREKKEEEEEDSFSQDSRASTTWLQVFFDASDTIDEEKEKNDDDDVFWDASDEKSKEWQEIVRSRYRWKRLEKKAPKFFFLCRRRKEQEEASRRRRCRSQGSNQGKGTEISILY